MTETMDFVKTMLNMRFEHYVEQHELAPEYVRAHLPQVGGEAWLDYEFDELLQEDYEVEVVIIEDAILFVCRDGVLRSPFKRYDRDRVEWVPEYERVDAETLIYIAMRRNADVDKLLGAFWYMNRQAKEKGDTLADLAAARAEADKLRRALEWLAAQAEDSAQLQHDTKESIIERALATAEENEEAEA
jgi:hypothetical protein